MVWRNPEYDAHKRDNVMVLWILKQQGIPKALARHFVEHYRPPPPKRVYAPLLWSIYVLASLLFTTIYMSLYSFDALMIVIAPRWRSHSYSMVWLSRSTFQTMLDLLCLIEELMDLLEKCI
jgi:hypothetical protein